MLRTTHWDATFLLISDFRWGSIGVQHPTLCINYEVSVYVIGLRQMRFVPGPSTFCLRTDGTIAIQATGHSARGSCAVPDNSRIASVTDYCH